MRARHLLILLPFATMAVHGLLFAFSQGPMPQLTGGFGEKTCVQCHGSFGLNEGRTRGGVFHILGVPKAYQGGKSYPIVVVAGHPGQSRWGFQLSVRHMASGAQAGQLTPVDELTQVREAGGVLYIMHTAAGSRPKTVDGPVEYRFNWIAPDTKGGAVLFNAAGNAADGKGEPMGDHIYTAGAYSDIDRAAAATPALTTEKQEQKREEWLSTSTRVLNLPAPKALNRGTWFFGVQHRFLGALKDARPGNAFGVDDGGNINLEVGYAATNRLSLGVARARWVTSEAGFAPGIISFSGAYSVHDDAKSFWKVSAVGGVEGQDNFERQYSPYLQLATSWDYKRLRAYVVPTMVFNSRDDREIKNRPSFAIHPEYNNTFALGVGGNLALHPRFSLSAEYVPRLAGFGGFGTTHPTVSVGMNMQTWRHVFTILVSRSRNFTPLGYAVNGDGPWALGFNIYRQFK